MLRRGFASALALACGLLAGHAAAPARAQTRDLTVVSWGGVYQDAQRDAYFRPFQQQTGTRLLEETWDGGIDLLREKIASGSNNWDVVQVEGEELLLGCAEDLFEPMDFDAIGGAGSYIPEAVSRCGVGAILYSFVLAFDRDRLPAAGAPKSWADFFDTDRFPGKRALRRGPKTTLEIALLADGVPAAEVYPLLATEAGLDRAFRKLEALKPQVQWWERGSQPTQWLARGDVAMTVAYNGRVSAANRGDGYNFGISWAGNLVTLDSWVIMKGSANRQPALDFLKFVGQPQVQAGLPARIAYGVTARGANVRLTSDVLADLPTAPANAEGALKLDDRFWVTNLDRLSKRFEDWLAR